MKLMKRYFLFLLVFISAVFTALPQINRYGIPFINRISPRDMDAGEQNWSVVQDPRGIIYLANDDNGIIEYDGSTWKKIPLPNNVPLREVFVDKKGNIYAGGNKEFGMLVPDQKGALQYHSLSERLDSADKQFKTILFIYSWKDNILFVGRRILYKYSPAQDVLTAYHLADEGLKQGIFGLMCNGQYYHLDAEKGLMEFDGEHFHKIPNGDFFSYTNLHNVVLSLLPYSKGRILVFTHKSGVFGYDPKTGAVEKNIFPEATNEFLKTNRFYNGVLLPDGSYALGTLNGGMILTDHHGRIRELLNRKDGIDSEITRIYYNPDKPEVSQLWIALNIGAAYAEIFSPFRMFSEDNGFRGTVNDMFMRGDDLYLATSTGVFRRTYDKDGIAFFERIEGINAQAWSFLYFTLPGSNRHVFWAGTEEGIYEINGNKAIPVERSIRKIPRNGFRFYVFKLYASRHDPGKIIIGTSYGFSVLRYRQGSWYYDGSLNDYQDEVRSIAEDENGNLWVSFSMTGIARIEKNDTAYQAVFYGSDKGLQHYTGASVYHLMDKIITTEKKIYTYDKEHDVFVEDTVFGRKYTDGTLTIQNIYPVNDSLFFFNTLHRDGSFHVEEVHLQKEGIRIIRAPFYRLPPQSAYTFTHEKDHLWIAISNRIYSYDLTYNSPTTPSFQTLIRRVTYGEDSVLFAGAFFTVDDHGVKHISFAQQEDEFPQIPYASNNLIFHWSAPYFEGRQGLRYSFRLRNFDKNWSKWTTHNEYPYTNIPNGSFVFEVKARNVYGQESMAGTYSFTILPPWYLTVWAFLLYIILAFLLIVVIVKLYTRRLQNEKIRLEAIVRERTAEVVRQKEELTDSIMYASRIQRAVLPSERVLNEQFPNHFILFLPRDIVSGDFYWMSHRDNRIFVTAADCTGHGVPGAFMSLLGISFLNEIINRIEVLQPDWILNELRKEIKTSLKQRGEEGEAKDGMDMAMVAIDKEKKKLFFSGAYNPLYYIRKLTSEEKEKIARNEDPGFGKGSLFNDEFVLISIPADKMPIGISAKDEIPFSLKENDYNPGDRIYMFSDGYIDQFGGPNGKKFMSRNFKKMILSMQDVPMKEQKEMFHQRLREWMGDLPQIDDIIVIGIQL